MILLSKSKDLELPENLEAWLREVCRMEGKVLSELGIFIVSDDELLKVNQDFLFHDYYTDIITFDRSFKNFVTGELWVSADRIRENAENLNIEILVETCRVLVHGVLHLLGYKDGSASEVETMRAKESEYLSMIF